jgi:hypothetical protein
VIPARKAPISPLPPEKYKPDAGAPRLAHVQGFSTQSTHRGEPFGQSGSPSFATSGAKRLFFLMGLMPNLWRMVQKDCSIRSLSSLLALILIGSLFWVGGARVSAGEIKGGLLPSLHPPPSVTEFKVELPDFQPPGFDLLSVDALGKVQSFPDAMEKRSDWLWMEAAPGQGRFPVLRTWLKLPAGVLLQPGDISSELKKSYAELKRDQEQDHTWYFDSVPGRSSVAIRWQDREGTPQQANMLVRFTAGRGVPVWLHPACRDQELVAAVAHAQGEARALPEFNGYIAVDCLAEGANGLARIAAQASAGLWLRAHTAPQLNKKESGLNAETSIDSSSLMLEVSAATESPTSQATDSLRPLADFVFGVSSGDAASKTGIEVDLLTRRSGRAGSAEAKSNWSWSSGLQLSLLGYRETDASGDAEKASSDQLGVTLKGGAVWRLFGSKADSEQSRWSLEGNAFFTALSLSDTLQGSADTSSDSGANNPRYLGVNLRAVRRLNSMNSEWKLSGAIGMYYWGMLVPEPTYGVWSLLGPQLMLSLAKDGAGERKLGGYIKLARTGGGLGFDLDQGREIALGGYFQLNDPEGARKWLMVIDIADTSCVSATADRAMSLTSWSAGLSVEY